MKHLLLVVCITSLFGGCAHWQTPQLAFDFDNFISAEGEGFEMQCPVKVVIPYPKFQNSLTGEYETAHGVSDETP